MGFGNINIFNPDQRAAIAINAIRLAKEEILDRTYSHLELMDVYLDESDDLLSLETIARLLFPEIYDRSSICASEALSQSCLIMNAQRIKAEIESGNIQLEEGYDSETYALHLAKKFHDQRTLRVNRRVLNDKVGANPDYYRNLSQLSNQSRGFYVWTQEVDEFLFRLVQDPVNMRGSREISNGAPNWPKIAGKLSDRFDTKFNSPQIQTRYALIIRNLNKYESLVEEYPTYYVSREKVNWEGMMEFIVKLLTDSQFVYQKNDVGGRPGQPRWRLILLHLDNLGYFPENYLNTKDKLKAAAKQACKAYKRLYPSMDQIGDSIEES